LSLARESEERRWLGFAALGVIALGAMFTLPNPQAALILVILVVLGLVCLVRARGCLGALLKVVGIFTVTGRSQS